MAKSVRITPASGAIEFIGDDGVTVARSMVLENGELHTKSGDAVNGTIMSAIGGNNASVGNIGTPKSDWWSAFNSIQIGDGTTLWGRASDTHLSSNYYAKDNSGTAQDAYINTSYANDFWLDNGDGTLIYRNAASGTAGTSITWNTRLKILNNGNVGIGTSTPGVKLDVNGSIRITGRTTPTSGKGLEIFYYSPSDLFYLEAYDYTNSAYKTIRYAGLSHQFITGDVAMARNLVLGNGSYGSDNAYSNWGARLMFNGSNSDAQGNYYIGTNGEDYGGNYSKLDLRWHTGIRMGAQAQYGGIRFFANEDLNTRIMSIGEGDSNIRIDNNLWIGGAGGWITDLLNAKLGSTAKAADSNLLDGLDSSVFMRKSANSHLDMNNYNIQEVNHITMNDPGYGEGIQWANMIISESPDDLSNQAGNLHIANAGDSSIRVTIDPEGNLYPSRDRLHLLGKETNRWQIVFCEILDSAGQHEKNLQNPEGEKSVGEYETGTVLVWKDGKNLPCTKYVDHMRMGIAVKGMDSPLIQGAEPVLVTGPVNEGDYLVTSSKKGHAEAISPELMRKQGLYDCVFGKALESAEGESHLVKTWINI